MRQDKLDKKFASKLHDREIKPSEKAWDRLDAMLSVADEKPKNVSFNWLYIAAALFVGSFITFQIYNAEPLIDSRVTESGSKEIMQEKPEVGTVLQNAEPETRVEKQASAIANNENKKLLKPSKRNSENSKTDIQKSRTTQEMMVEREQSQIAEVILPPKTIEPRQQLNINPTLKKPSKISVSGSSLLAETDREINYTFREKVIKKLAQASSEIAEAVSERNNH